MKFRDGISIIVTVYNKEQFISKTLQSITEQMESRSQLIIVNDGSTDKSEKKIKQAIKMSKKDIKLLRIKNSGPSIATNKALKFVKYSFIKLVDGDDIIAPDTLSYMKNEMIRLNLDLLYGHWIWKKKINNYKFKKDSQPAFIIKNALKKFITGGWGGSSNLMVKSSVMIEVGGCDENVFVQDYSLPLRISGYHKKKKENRKYKIGQSNKLICVGPSFIENRIISNKDQLLYDLSIATLNFIKTHPFVEKSQIKKCKKKILSRCWVWQKRNNGASFFSHIFLAYIFNRYIKLPSLDLLKLIIYDTWKDSDIRKNVINEGQEKILIYVGLDLLGDALLKLPFLKHTKEIFPNSKLFWLSGKGESIFKRKLKPLSKNIIFKVYEKNYGSNIFDIFKKDEIGNFDIVIDTQKRLLTTLILKTLPSKIFISSSANFLFSDFVPSFKKEENLTKQLINLANIFTSKKYDGITHQQLIRSRDIIICPGASVEWKRWDTENFIEIAIFLKKKSYNPIFI